MHVLVHTALVTYIIWRWWEGITQQGAHEEYGRAKNFFSFRLSPLVSGCVYLGYLVYCITLLPKVFKGVGQDVSISPYFCGLQAFICSTGLRSQLSVAPVYPYSHPMCYWIHKI